MIKILIEITYYATARKISEVINSFKPEDKSESVVKQEKRGAKL